MACCMEVHDIHSTCTKTENWCMQHTLGARKGVWLMGIGSPANAALPASVLLGEEEDAAPAPRPLPSLVE